MRFGFHFDCGISREWSFLHIGQRQAGVGIEYCRRVDRPLFEWEIDAGGLALYIGRWCIMPTRGGDERIKRYDAPNGRQLYREGATKSSWHNLWLFVSGRSELWERGERLQHAA